MKNIVDFDSPEARITLSHVSDGDLVLEIRRPVDDKRDRLDWICVPLAQVSGIVGKAHAATNGAQHSRAANDDQVGSTAKFRFDSSDFARRPAHTPA